MTNDICKYTGARELPPQQKDGKVIPYREKINLCRGCNGEKNCSDYKPVKESKLKKQVEIPCVSAKEFEELFF